MNGTQPTEASVYLRALARRIAEVYAAMPTTRAIILTGSSAEGVSDQYSDIDMIVYYDTLPSEEALRAACERNQGQQRRPLAERTEGAFMETFFVQGVDCQIVHATIATWEEEIATVLEQLDVTTPLQKALGGLLDAIPLFGETYIQKWQAQLRNYPDALAEAMVNHYLAFFPLWGLQGRIGPRDATIWRYQMLVESAQNMLGVLAGLNRHYYATFQFKRMNRFIAQLEVAPTKLGDRLESLFHADPASAGAELERLVSETIALVEQHMPQIDTRRARQRLGWRQKAWEIQPGIVAPGDHSSIHFPRDVNG